MDKMMRYTAVRTFVCAAAAIFMYAAPSAAQSPDASLVVTNETGQEIGHLFVRPYDSNAPGGDLLSLAGPIEVESSFSTGISISFSETLVHVLAVGEDGAVFEKENVRVSDTETVLLSLSETHLVDTGEAPATEDVTVSADFGTDIYYVFAERSDSSELGPNITGGEVIPEGSSATVRIATGDSGGVRSLLVVDSFGGTARIETQ